MSLKCKNYLLFIIYYLLFIIYYLLFIIYYLFVIIFNTTPLEINKKKTIKNKV